MMICISDLQLGLAYSSLYSYLVHTDIVLSLSHIFLHSHNYIFSYILCHNNQQDNLNQTDNTQPFMQEKTQKVNCDHHLKNFLPVSFIYQDTSKIPILRTV